MAENFSEMGSEGATSQEVDFKKELYRILEDKMITPDEAQELVTKFDLEKANTVQYTYRQIALLKEALGNAFVGTETRVDKETLRQYILSQAKLSALPPCDPTPVEPTAPAGDTPPRPSEAPQITLPVLEEINPETPATESNPAPTPEKPEEERLKVLQEYFHLKESQIQRLKESIQGYSEATGLGKESLSIVKFLEDYKQYIETNLVGLDSHIVENIKTAIGRKSLKLADIIQERVDFVKGKIASGDYLETSLERELTSERRNIQHALSNNFDFINHQVLPSALMLKKSQDQKGDLGISESEMEEFNKRLATTQAMLGAPVDEEGNFDRTLRDTMNNGKIWQAYSEHWDVFDDRENGMLVKKKVGMDQTKLFQDTPDLTTPSILNEQDREVDAQAMKLFMAAIALQISVEVGPAVASSMIPGGMPFGVAAGGIAGGAIDVMDVFSDTETLMDLLQSTGLVPDDYRMSKTVWDNILAGVGLIPGATVLIRSKALKRLAGKYGDFKKEITKLVQLATTTDTNKILRSRRGISGATEAPKVPRKVIDPTKVEAKTTQAREFRHLMETLPEAQRFLNDAGLYLSNKITINGFEYFASDKFTSKGITYVMSFVEVGGKPEPRVFRLGNNGTTWQSVPGFHGKDGFPSGTELSSVDKNSGVNIDAGLARLLNQLPSGSEIPDIGTTFGRYFGYFSDPVERFRVTPLQSAFNKENGAIRSNKIGQEGFNFIEKKARISEILHKMRTLDMSHFDLSHFKKISTNPEIRADQHFGSVEIQRYETMFDGKKAEVSFVNSSGEPDLVWVESIRFVGDKVNSFGLPSNPIDGGLLTSAPFQKVTRIPEAIIQSGAPIVREGSAGFIDVRRFLQGNPLIAKMKSVESSQ